MIIIHVALCGPVTDGWNYQENILTKYHAKMGNEVYLIASKLMWGDKGKYIYSTQDRYVNDDYVIMVRLDEKVNNPQRKFKRFPGLSAVLEDVKPDILFVHGCQFLDVFQITRYIKKNKNTKLYVDNHADFGNSGRNFFSKYVLHGILWRYMAHKLLPYTEKFWGVLPARVDFLKNVYKLPENKCSLLVMGADDELVSEACKASVKESIREQSHIEESDFLIVTGGKINKSRPETIDLIKAVCDLNLPNVKLLIFGVVSEEYKEQFDKYLSCDKIVYVGWKPSNETYSYMAAADLIVFPGLHSVMWEQAVALGVPCVFRKLDGFDHVDIGGNAIFVDDFSCDSFAQIIRSICDKENDTYQSMLKVAQSNSRSKFLYSRIAENAVK